MKLYKTKSGPVIEKENRFYLLSQDWESFVNDDFLFEKMEKVITGSEVTLCDKPVELMAPIGEHQELWACGVTYLRSKIGRQEESKSGGGADFYAKVYEADRPEVFFKANPPRVVGHHAYLRIRKDSSWDVPEPELTLVVSLSGKILGYTIGNDMSSRSIEGENPLYLPQAKTYDGCAALGPCIYVTGKPLNPQTRITLEIIRNNKTEFKDHISIDQMKRKQEELVSFVFRECSFPFGCLIMTGTGIVPGNDFTLHSGDEILIEIEGIGKLINTIR
jgi:2-dehydro-3-deoxy-D-arabinonate dehydratase